MARPRFEIVDNLQLDYRAVRTDAADLLHEALDSARSPILRASIDATHSGRLTNMRVYPGRKMKKSMKTFLEPVPKPVLKHHKDDEDPIGRVSSAEYVQLKSGDEFRFDYKNPGKGVGSGYIKLGLDIADPDAMQKFADGRFQQFSTRQHFQDVYCSVCGENIADDMAFGGMFSQHEHQVGEVYRIKGEGKRASDHLCYLITGDLDYKEVSPVNIPGDSHSKLNGFQIVEPNEATDMAVMTCAGDGLVASVDSLSLATRDASVDLLAGGAITSEERRQITGKTVVAVSPSFVDNVDDQDSEDMTKQDATVDPTETKDQDAEDKNTDTSAASKGDGENSSSEKDGETKEGVVAPESKSSDKGSSDQGGISAEALAASVEALTAQLTAARKEAEESASKATRLEAQLAERDAEIDRQKTAAADALTETKGALARQLMSDRLLLQKADVSAIDSSEAYDEKLAEFAERSLDSLKDALEDLKLEVAEAAKKVGVKSPSDFAKGAPVENPVKNTPAPSKDKEEEPKAPKTKRQALESLILD